MKDIFTFTINKAIDKEIKEETPEGTLIKKERAYSPVNIILKSPSRLEREQALEFEAAEWSKAVSAGVLTRQMLSKIYSDNGGVFSKEEVKNSAKLLEDYNDKVITYQKLILEDKDSEDAKILRDEITDLYTKIQNLEFEREELFRNSAETRARDKAIQWLILFLTYIQDGNVKPRPFFGEGDFEDRLNKLYELSEFTDEFTKSVIEKSALYITFWHLGKLSKKEDFEFLEKELNKSSTNEPS